MKSFIAEIYPSSSKLIFSLFAWMVLSLISTSSFAQTENNSTKKFRVGVYLEAGQGFDEMDFFETNDGTISTLSPGGGFGGSFYFGYFISESLEIAITAGTQQSDLSDELENASAEFTRSVIRITPKYYFNFNEKHKMSIGAGVGFYNNGELDADGSEVPGGAHIICEYDSEMGFHFQPEYYFVLSPKWSLSTGLMYYGVNYGTLTKLTSGSNSLPLSLATDEVKELKGSGIDVLIGVYYHF